MTALTSADFELIRGIAAQYEQTLKSLTSEVHENVLSGYMVSPELLQELSTANDRHNAARSVLRALNGYADHQDLARLDADFTGRYQTAKSVHEVRVYAFIQQLLAANTAVA